MTIYDHCNQVIDDLAEVYPCQPDAVKEIFIPFQVGYIIRFTDYFGLNVFTEYTITDVIDTPQLRERVQQMGELPASQTGQGSE